MLLRFGVRNFISIRDAEELSLVASTLSDPSDGLIESKLATQMKILPVAIVYGANASGKSNVVAAFEQLRSVVLFSHSHGTPEGGVPRRPFALDEACASETTEFSVDFEWDNSRYQFGFGTDGEVITEEWLYSTPGTRRQTLYVRSLQDFKFGRSLRGKNRVISELTRPNSLFISAAAQNGHEELSKVSRFFRSIHVEKSITQVPHLIPQIIGTDLDERVIEFLRNIGTGVTSYSLGEKYVSEEVLEMRTRLVDFLSDLAKGDPLSELRDRVDEKESDLKLAHKGRGDDDVLFELEQESAGTRRLLVVLTLVFRALDHGATLFIDEFDASLHTQACEAILGLFANPKINTRGAQLIATTHDTNLLDSKWLRRDQIWFTEKDSYGATHIYPLTDIRTRKGDNLERGYLQGRYGAIPYGAAVNELVSAK
ncbi:MAG: ATP-binding protein [Pseudomonadota bacterium]